MWSGYSAQSSCPPAWLSAFTEWTFSYDYTAVSVISQPEQVAELLTQERTHDPIGRGDGRGVCRSDEWWSAGVASVEAGHGRKTGIDVWRDWVCGVILENREERKVLFSIINVFVWDRKKERAYLFILEIKNALWRLPGCHAVKVRVAGEGQR